MAQQILSTNTFTTAKWIVSSDATQGTHTTIAGALTSASSGDTIFIRPGTYTENLTLKAGVNLTAYGSDSSLNATGNVIISGKCTMTTAGTVTISGIQLQTNSDFLLAVTGSAASVVNLNNCYLNCTNNTGISYSSSNGSSAINIFYCSGNLATTGIVFWSSSSGGTLSMEYCDFINTGSSTTVSTNSAGSVSIGMSTIESPISSTSTGALTILGCNISLIAAATAITFNGTGNGTLATSRVDAISGSAVSVGTGVILHCDMCLIGSSNTNAITGAGQINLGAIDFYGSSSTINTNTVTSQVTQAGSLNLNTPLTSANGGTGANNTATSGTILRGNGTNFVTSTNTFPNTATTGDILIATGTNVIGSLADVAVNQVLVSGGVGAAPAYSATPTVTSITFGAGSALNTYVEAGTFTPTLSFGGGSTGIVYVTQYAKYSRIGNQIFVNYFVQISSKGSSTGIAAIGNLPYTSNATQPAGLAIALTSGITADSGYSYFTGSAHANSTLIYCGEGGSGSASQTMSNTNFANASYYYGSLVYIP